ncbi:MAG: hypothetical protein ACRDWH_07900 [Acidimicrobiia bacterium]
MKRRQGGAALVIAGALLSGFGAADLLEGDASLPATTTTFMGGVTTSSTTPATTGTTTPATSTTTAAVSTTEPAVGIGDVEAFVAAYRTALDADDLAFLVSRLHPTVKQGYGEDLCEAWVAREIVLLEQYQLTGPLSGPRPETFAMANGSFGVDDVFSGPISFVFQGSPFEGRADFAVLDGLVYWLGICR